MLIISGVFDRGSRNTNKLQLKPTVQKLLAETLHIFAIKNSIFYQGVDFSFIVICVDTPFQNMRKYRDIEERFVERLGVSAHILMKEISTPWKKSKFWWHQQIFKASVSNFCFGIYIKNWVVDFLSFYLFVCYGCQTYDIPISVS